MKICACCHLEEPDHAAATCARCGEGSWTARGVDVVHVLAPEELAPVEVSPLAPELAPVLVAPAATRRRNRRG